MPAYAKENEVLYHTNLSREMLRGARYALLPGDPGRVWAIAGEFENRQPLAVHREYTSCLCYCIDLPIVVCSTGMGGPSVAICLEELARLGITHFIRIGTTGSIQEKIALGDVIINNAAVRLDGTSSHYAPEIFPAVADFELVSRLVASAERMMIPHHVGISVSSDTFWPGQERYDSFTGYVLPKFRGSLDMWRQLGALNCEMETSTLFVVAQALGLSAASICGVVVARNRSEQPAGKEVYDLSQKRIYDVLKNLFLKLVGGEQHV